MNTEQLLDVVKDGEKFKSKLAELAKAEDSAKAANEKARAAQKEMAQAVDAGRAELEVVKQDIRRREEAAMKPVTDAQNALAKREAKLNQDIQKFEQAAERLKNGQARLKSDKEAVKADHVAFQARVEAFEKAVKQLAERA